MKKLFVLVLVMLMVSSAAIANTIVVQQQGGGTDYVAGTTVTIEIAATGFPDTIAGKVGQLDIAAITTSNLGASVSSVGVLNPILTTNLGWTNGALGTPPNLIEGIVGRATIGQGVANDILYTFDLNIGGGTVGDITIDLAGLVLANPFSQRLEAQVGPLTLVPEPMTLGLLGLGGLFLRRRKK